MPDRDGTVTRRRFMLAGAAWTAAPMVITSQGWGRVHRPAPSGRITMGLIGCGGMGGANLHSFLRKPEVQVVAVCDPDRERRDDARQRVDAFYAKQTDRGSRPDGACTAYNDFRELIARDDVDAVIIASPDHWHALHVVASAQAGKDIYGEKPLSLTVRQGRVMADAVRRYGRVFQTGSQQRSDARFRRACEIVRNDRLGKLTKVTCGLPGGEVTGNHPPLPVPDGFDYDMWLGPAPWAPYCSHRTHYVFRHILDYSGGKLTDWGAHHVDIAQWALGLMNSGPVEVDAQGEHPRDGLWDAPINYDVECRYQDGLRMLVTSRAENGVLFEGTRGTLFVARGTLRADPASLLDEEILPSEQKLPVSDDHHQNFLDCVRSRREPIAPIEHAHRTITVAHLGNISMRVGRPIRWDPRRERILDDPIAARRLDRPMRSPWRL